MLVAAVAAIGVGCGEDEVDVRLTRVGDSPIQVIREVRTANGMGLADAKALIDSAPSVVVENVSRDDAERLERRLEAAGASVELRQ